MSGGEYHIWGDERATAATIPTDDEGEFSILSVISSNDATLKLVMRDLRWSAGLRLLRRGTMVDVVLVLVVLLLSGMMDIRRLWLVLCYLGLCFGHWWHHVVNWRLGLCVLGLSMMMLLTTRLMLVVSLMVRRRSMVATGLGHGHVHFQVAVRQISYKILGVSTAKMGRSKRRRSNEEEGSEDSRFLHVGEHHVVEEMFWFVALRLLKKL